MTEHFGLNPSAMISPTMISPIDALPEIPEQIKAPTGARLLLRAHASGLQIYICQATRSGEPEWILRAPEANLYDQHGSQIGWHYAGPTWKHQDGSKITAKVAARVDSPRADAIPWLLLTVTSHSVDGILNSVTAIHRVYTVGGLPPATSNLGSEAKIPYEAEYYFYTGG